MSKKIFWRVTQSKKKETMKLFVLGCSICITLLFRSMLVMGCQIAPYVEVVNAILANETTWLASMYQVEVRNDHLMYSNFRFDKVSCE